MTAEGYLYTKRGTGTFTVPRSISLETNKQPLIGVRIGTGDLFYYSGSTLNYLGTIFQILSGKNCNVRLLTESAGSSEEYEELLDNSYIDALISISEETGFTKAAATRIPVVSVGIEAEGANNIVYEGNNVAKELLEQRNGDRKLKIVNFSTEKDLKYLNQSLRADSGVDFTHSILSFKNEDEVSDAKEIISRDIPDIIMLRSYQTSIISRILNELNIPSERTKLLCIDASCPKSFDTNMRLNLNLVEIMKFAADELFKILGGEENKRFRHVFEFDLIHQ